MVTICTFKKEPFFDLPASRAILEEIWLELPQRFKKLQLDEFVIMSDHVYVWSMFIPAFQREALRSMKLTAALSKAAIIVNVNKAAKTRQNIQ